MGSITLITGGVRSGKSAFALSLALKEHTHRAFIATAQALDEEMEERIAKHQHERGSEFTTIEEPIELMRTINSLDAHIGIAVVDCLTVWLGNLFHSHDNDPGSAREDVDIFFDALSLPAPRCDLIVVTNEVGWGIVPENKLARDYRDLAGYTNRRMAELAKSVYLCICGIHSKIKG